MTPYIWWSDALNLGGAGLVLASVVIVRIYAPAIVADVRLLLDLDRPPRGEARQPSRQSERRR